MTSAWETQYLLTAAARQADSPAVGTPEDTDRTPVRCDGALAPCAGTSRALDGSPGPAPQDALQALRSVAGSAQDHSRALKQLARSLARNATNPLYFLSLGRQLREAGRYEEAAQALRRAVQIDPQFVAGYLELGDLCREHSPAEAESHWRQAHELDPSSCEALRRLAERCLSQRRIAEATRYCEQWLQQQPHRPEPYLALGSCCLHGGDVRQALDWYERGLQREPFDPEARLALGLIALQRGDYAYGWRQFAWRRRRREAALRWGGQRTWDGTPLRDGMLVVHPEGSMCDDVLFASCFSELRGAAAHVVLVTPEPLLPLWRRSFPWANVVAQNDWESGDRDAACAAQHERDVVHVLAGSVPRWLRPDPRSFARQAPYLVADDRQRAAWRSVLERLPPGRRVGLVMPRAAASHGMGNSKIASHDVGSMWRVDGAGPPGGPPTPHLQTEDFCDLWDVGPIAWVLLSAPATGRAAAGPDGASAALQPDPARPCAWRAATPSLDWLAALVVELDVVIAPAGLTAHLAGALGARAWTLLPPLPSWRWGLDETSCLWFPGMRLFRQRAGEPWRGVMQRVADELLRAGDAQPRTMALRRLARGAAGRVSSRV